METSTEYLYAAGTSEHILRKGFDELEISDNLSKLIETQKKARKRYINPEICSCFSGQRLYRKQRRHRIKSKTWWFIRYYFI